MVIKIILDKFKNRLGFVKQFLFFFGGISYELYLIHGYTLPIIKTNWSLSIRMAIFIGVTIVVALALQYVTGKVNGYIKIWSEKNAK